MPVRGTYTFPMTLDWRLDGASGDPTAPLVLCLHGMGMQEDAFARVLARLFELPCRFLVPRAPYPVELRAQRRIGAAWYAYDGDAERFRAELERTESLLLGLVRAVEARESLAPRRRLLFGFSQGGYCGAWVALRHPEVFDGLVVSGARVKTELLADELPRAAACGFQVLLVHGARDSAVPADFAARSHAALCAAGIDVELETFDSGHALEQVQLDAIAGWIRRRFP